MNNGCVCCTVRQDLIETFHQMFKNELFATLDWVVIETTGMIAHSLTHSLTHTHLTYLLTHTHRTYSLTPVDSLTHSSFYVRPSQSRAIHSNAVYGC